jgi:uncharacterized protein with HEPN domain
MQIPGLRHALFLPRDYVPYMQKVAVMIEQYQLSDRLIRKIESSGLGVGRNGRAYAYFLHPKDITESVMKFLLLIQESETGSSRHKVMEQRDTAWQELRDIRTAICADPEESTPDEVHKVIAHRDELLSAAKLALDWLVSTGADGSPLAELREAIAKVEATHG